jgi:hypothetical protein
VNGRKKHTQKYRNNADYLIIVILIKSNILFICVLKVDPEVSYKKSMAKLDLNSYTKRRKQK